VENQEMADKRIPHLLAIPATVRFLSVEPMLGSIDLSKPENVQWCNACGRISPTTELPGGTDFECGHCGDSRTRERSFIECLDWAIVGGESGPRARPCKINWIRSIVKQCRAAGVAPFAKQLGTNIDCDEDDPAFAWFAESLPLSDPKGGDPTEWPEDLRVREFPE
jgi:hypothetical protein